VIGSGAVGIRQHAEDERSVLRTLINGGKGRKSATQPNEAAAATILVFISWLDADGFGEHGCLDGVVILF